MEAVTSAPVRALLQERRGRLNSLFLQARTNYPQLNGDAFLAHLKDTVLPVLERVHAHDATRSVVVLEALYEISLRLVAQGLMGPSSKSRVIEQAWRHLLEAAPGLLCEAPTRIATSLANALVQLAEVDPKQALRWHEGMANLAAHAKSPQEWLAAGLVMSWCSGLPHYRESALSKARELDARLGGLALGLTAPLSQDAYEKILSLTEAQPWITPQEHQSGAVSKPALQAMGWIGGFAGFGGHFATPPVALAQGDRLLLRDDRHTWHLAADCFGVLLKRDDSAAMVAPKTSPAAMTLAKNGVVASSHGEWRVTAAADAVSYAATTTTVVVVPRDSHRALVLGLRWPLAAP